MSRQPPGNCVAVATADLAMLELENDPNKDPFMRHKVLRPLLSFHLYSDLQQLLDWRRSQRTRQRDSS